MKTTTKTKVSLTKLEKEFIIAYFESVAETLNYSRLEDVAYWLKPLTIEQAKGVFGSLVNKGVFDPAADTYDANFEKYDVMGLTSLVTWEQLQEIAAERKMYLDFEDIDYDYIRYKK
jgi:hypothetical protein